MFSIIAWSLLSVRLITNTATSFLVPTVNVRGRNQPIPKVPMSKKPLEIWLDLPDDGGSVEAEAPTLPPEWQLHVSRTWKGPLGVQDVAEITLDDQSSQAEAMSLIGMVPIVLVRCPEWTMIPLENLVAAADGTGTRIACAIDRATDVPGAANALQIGVDCLVLPPPSTSTSTSTSSDGGNDPLWKVAVAEKVSRPSHTDISGNPNDHDRDNEENANTHNVLVPARVIEVVPAGVGERVCIDLTERLVPGEGACVGSLSNTLCAVHAECLPSQFVAQRPFRINAGPVSSYVLMGDGKTTKYLSEVQGGDRITVVRLVGEGGPSKSNDGKSGKDVVIEQRSATVGRAKIERRPFVCVKYQYDEGVEQQGQVLLQQAETVRLLTPGDNPVSVTDLVPGDFILTRLDTCTKMRHLGTGLSNGQMREQ